MTESQLLNAVRHLRHEGCSPKEIARSLGVATATVSHLVRVVAREDSDNAVEPELAGCWVSPGWSEGLEVEHHAEWQYSAPSGGCEGLATVVVAREYSGARLSVCSFLVDTYCLGVKQVVGPLLMKSEKLCLFRNAMFGGYSAQPLAAPIELAQHLVFGAVEYARSLGFEPDPDYPKCVGHLGTWSAQSAIRFGCRGKPMYVAGPRDDSRRVMQTLEHSVGNGNFDVIIAVPDDA
jgi:hypothetical protein